MSFFYIRVLYRVLKNITNHCGRQIVTREIASCDRAVRFMYVCYVVTINSSNKIESVYSDGCKNNAVLFVVSMFFCPCRVRQRLLQDITSTSANYLGASGRGVAFK